MSPLQPSRPAAPSVLARIALRRVAVPVDHPRVFQVFEQMRDKAVRQSAVPAPHPARPGH